MTALRIWVSLPDELTHDPSQPGHRGGHASGHSPGGSREPATCNLYCNCSLQRVSSGRVMQVYHHQQQEDLVDEIYNAMTLVPDNCLSSSSIVNMDPPSYSDCLQVYVLNIYICLMKIQDSFSRVPSNSNTNVNTDISEYLNISDISEGVEEPPPPYSSLKIETTSIALFFNHDLQFVILICCCRYIAPSVFTLFVIGRPLRLDLLTRNV